MTGPVAVLGLTTQEAIGFTIAILVIVLFLGGLAYVTRARRDTRPKPDIPPVMRPAPTDADLEKPRLEKLQGWALASIVFLGPSVRQSRSTAKGAETLSGVSASRFAAT